MSKHVIIMEFPWGRDKDPRVPLGHASLISTLECSSNISYSSLIYPVNEANESLTEQIITEINHILTTF